MDIANTVLVAFIGIIIAVLIWVTVISKKKKWYKVYMANNDILLLYRDLNERWFRTNSKYMRFKDEYNKEVTFPSNARWVLMWKEIDDNEIDVVRDEIKRLKEEMVAKEVED